MPVYKVQLQALGEITSLPDSQKVFGALIYVYANKVQNDDEVKTIFEHKRIQQVSNVFPKGYISNGYVWDEKYTLSIGTENFVIDNTILGDTDNTFKNGYKKYKANPYISFQESGITLKSSTTFKDMNNTYDIANKSGGVFSQNYLQLTEEGEKKSIKRDFYFLIQCETDIKSVLFDNETTVLKLGPRATRGMNLYEVTRVEEVEIEMTSAQNIYLNLGMLGLNNRMHIDQEQSHIKTYTSKRKGYENYKSEANVQYINTGSIIKLVDEKSTDDIERFVKIEEKRYLYTAGFLLPLEEGQ